MYLVRTGNESFLHKLTLVAFIYNWPGENGILETVWHIVSTDATGNKLQGQ